MPPPRQQRLLHSSGTTSSAQSARSSRLAIHRPIHLAARHVPRCSRVCTTQANMPEDMDIEMKRARETPEADSMDASTSQVCLLVVCALPPLAEALLVSDVSLRCGSRCNPHPPAALCSSLRPPPASPRALPIPQRDLPSHVLRHPHLSARICTVHTRTHHLPTPCRLHLAHSPLMGLVDASHHGPIQGPHAPAVP
jgi:hypothetical protein